MATQISRQAPLTRHVLTVVMAVTFALWGGQATSWAAQPGAPTSPQAEARGGAARPRAQTPAAAAPSPSSIDEGYASREAAAPDLQSFKGGDVVIIGSTGLVLILVII